MIVYHGSTDVIKQPDVKHSYRLLDFGQGFYVTTVKEQAVRWARRKSALKKGITAMVNCYQIAFITQKAIDQLLIYDSCIEV